MPNHETSTYSSTSVCGGYSRGTRLLGSRSPPTPCVPFAEEFQPYTKAKAISDDGFASSSQLPGYEQDTTTYLRYHVYLRTRRERVE